MFVVLLALQNKDKVAEFLDGHKAWLKRGFDDGVFLVAGGLHPIQGGGIIAHGMSLGELQARVNEDPFVAEDAVTVEILEITPSFVDERLNFLLDPTPAAA